MKNLYSVALWLVMAGSLPVCAQSGLPFAGPSTSMPDAANTARIPGEELLPLAARSSGPASTTPQFAKEADFFQPLPAPHRTPADWQETAAPTNVLASPSAPQPALPAASDHAPGPRLADWSYWTVNGLLAGSTVAHAQALSNCPNCTFVPSSLHRPGLLYGVGLPVDAAVAYGGYLLKKNGHRWWFVPAALLTVGNSYLAYHWASNTN